MLKQPQLFSQGYHLQSITLPEVVKSYVRNEQWKELENDFLKLTAPEGEVFQQLQSFYDFSKIEIMISIRDAQNEWEEDGIWHDDGSRVFAFSLSLTEHAHEVGGGRLGIRRTRSTPSESDETMALIPTPEYGTAILFLTGIHGYEHKTHRVTKGRRVILVGWCS